MLGRVRSVLRARRVAAALTAGLVTGVLVTTGAPSAAADVYASPGTGAHAVNGAILDEYRLVGGPQGRLGYPVTDELPTPRGGGRFNHFQNGSIYWSPWGGAHEMFGAIRGQWAALGWESGLLGFPVTDEFPVGHGGVAQNFTGGSIYWSAQTGAHSVIGAIRERWGAMAWEQGWLGLPTTDEIKLRRGAFQLFQGGAVYWSPATGAQAVRGAIAARWGEWGYENGPLGYPVSSEIPLGTGGASTHFQGGTISWHPATGAHVVVGAIRDLWAGMGWEGSPLGHPTSSEYSVPGGRRTDFQHGSITWTPLLGAAPDVTITGWGQQYVSLPLGTAPMMVSTSTGASSGYFSAWALDTAGQETDLVASRIRPPYTGTRGLNLGWGDQIGGFDVSPPSNSSWTVHVMPLAWATPFDRYQPPLTGTGDAVLHYVGAPGTVQITTGGSDYSSVWSYTNRGDIDDLLSNGSGQRTATSYIPRDVYITIETSGPWSIQVV